MGPYSGEPHSRPSVAIYTHLRGSPASPSTALGWLTGLAISPVNSFSVLFCWGVWNHFLLEESTKASRLPAPGTSIHNCPASGPPAARLGCARRRIGKHFLDDFYWSLPQDRVHGRPVGQATRGRGLFSFLPQLVTQGSSVHGLSNKLTVELKHACLRLSSLNVLSLLPGAKDFGSDR